MRHWGNRLYVKVVQKRGSGHTWGDLLAVAEKISVDDEVLASRSRYCGDTDA